MKHLAGFAVLLSLTIAGASQAMACYTVYSPSNQIVYNAQTPPVDMRYQIHQVLPSVYPGGHMVFGSDPDCPVVSVAYPRTAVVARMDTRTGMRPRPDRN